ncbi:hypothetical protein [Phenylobacterium sp.]|jgi:hypothetical protein|uniref:hypothetical protein n=1 Tax=Phenylobacterium sp. TaxID=1871053 RepID=UPI002F3E7B27
MLLTVLIYLGDAVWILALALMAGASRAAWNRMDAATLVPLQPGRAGSPRARRNLALSAAPGVAFLASLFLLAGVRSLGLTPEMALILFGVRIVLAALATLAHLGWLRAVMAQLKAEGALRS